MAVAAIAFERDKVIGAISFPTSAEVLSICSRYFSSDCLLERSQQIPRAACARRMVLAPYDVVNAVHEQFVRL